ncbi:chemotaxis protein CheC [Effusibacillus dendaii]|uniref:CheY-P-specific phosphatase CheC n=1 Tax=Effusibacillus dendaii TaxID=2743772 RepID=A0A7I8D5A0_9BACL|nr:chemotaxis protein CheC [Effusibacillus dendaii]BCJ85284.1 CheY-P-specific phosphatase CheC [Effusibacillus dendaii]
MQDPFSTINKFQLSVFQEIGNIGAGHAATALSILMQKEVEMSVPRVHVAPLQEVDEVVGNSEQEVVGVFFRVDGDITGSMFMMLHVESAKMLLSALMPGSEVNLYNEYELSALMEIGNILCGSYISAFSDLTQSKMYQSVPAISIDMAGALLNVAFMHVGMSCDTVLVVETEFRQGNENVESQFFFLPDPASLQTIFKRLGVEHS